MRSEKYFLLPTSYLLLFNNVFYKGVPKHPKVVRLHATFYENCTKHHKTCIKNHVRHCKYAETGIPHGSAARFVCMLLCA